MTDLQRLIEAVECGDECTHIFAKVFPVGSKRNTWLHSAFNGSLDAAKFLHDALLPGWALERLTVWPGEDERCVAVICGTHCDDGEIWHHHTDGQKEASSNNPARAWLIAILKAYQAQQVTLAN